MIALTSQSPPPPNARGMTMLTTASPRIVPQRIASGVPPPGDGTRGPESASPQPRDTLELQLTNVWEKVLGVRPIGIGDNFFELGGDSLLAVRLFIEVEKICGSRLPMAMLFQAPTIEQLAAALRQEGWGAAWSSLVAIQPSGLRPPLFMVHAVGGNVLNYRDLVRYLGRDQPVYGLQAQGLDGQQQPYTRIEDMAAVTRTAAQVLTPAPKALIEL